MTEHLKENALLGQKRAADDHGDDVQAAAPLLVVVPVPAPAPAPPQQQQQQRQRQRLDGQTAGIGAEPYQQHVQQPMPPFPGLDRQTASYTERLYDLSPPPPPPPQQQQQPPAQRNRQTVPTSYASVSPGGGGGGGGDGGTRFRCQARGRPPAHVGATIFVPNGATHRQPLACSCPEFCAFGRFMWCMYCKVPTATRNFSRRHGDMASEAHTPAMHAAPAMPAEPAMPAAPAMPAGGMQPLYPPAVQQGAPVMAAGGVQPLYGGPPAMAMPARLHAIESQVAALNNVCALLVSQVAALSSKIATAPMVPAVVPTAAVVAPAAAPGEESSAAAAALLLL